MIDPFAAHPPGIGRRLVIRIGTIARRWMLCVEVVWPHLTREFISRKLKNQNLKQTPMIAMMMSQSLSN
jgi:hypothetical protein